MWTEQSCLTCSCSFASHGQAPYVTDSRPLEQGVNQHVGVAATEASPKAWADLWRDVWRDINAWGGLCDGLSVREVKAHTTPEVVFAGVISSDDQLGNDLADALQAEGSGAPCPALYFGGEALGQLGRHLHGSLDCASWVCEATSGH